MIIVKIWGGLGNQLFQYAFGRFIENRLKTKVLFDSQTNIKIQNFTKRDLDIENFDVNINVASNKEIGKFLYFNDDIFWRVERKFTQKMPFLRKSHIVQNNAHDVLANLRNDCYYDGYWQCHKYVNEIRKDLLQEIKPSSNFLISQKGLLDQMDINNSVSIHIRRDDYIKIKGNSKLFEICEIDYYRKAITFFRNKLKNPQFFIFTQDKEWAHENFVGDDFVFVKSNSAIDDMLLMAQCKHNIIANSTFSWWGAWLNQNTKKIVIAPKKWYKGNRNLQTLNLIPKEWMRI